VFTLALALTSGSLALLTAVSTTGHHAVELGVLVTASGLATALRFTLLRSWVFKMHETRSGATLSPSC
jgi:hypothetical protein